MNPTGASVRVDPATGQVAIGGHGLEAPIDVEIDLRTGSAAVELSGRRYLVGTLRWAELGALARFAHLGPAFVRRELVRLAVHAGEGQPAETGQEEILSAVAMWLATAGHHVPLDLDPADIAAATRDVCRSLRIAPAELDGRPAPDVAALWRSCAPAGEGRATGLAGRAVPEPATPQKWSAMEELAAAEDDDGYTRILIVPDEDLPGPAEQEDGTRPRNGGREDASAPPDQIAVAASPATEAPSRTPPPAPAARRLYRDDPGQQERGRTTRPGGLRFRVVPPSPPPDPGASPPGGPPAAGFAAGTDLTASAGSLTTGMRPGPGAGAVTAAVRPDLPPRSAPPWHEATVLRPGSVPFAQVEPGLPVASGSAGMRPSRNTAALRPSPSWAELAPDPPGQDRWEALFDGLAERLEEAAAQMGIDLEG